MLHCVSWYVTMKIIQTVETIMKILTIALSVILFSTVAHAEVVKTCTVRHNGTRVCDFSNVEDVGDVTQHHEVSVKEAELTTVFDLKEEAATDDWKRMVQAEVESAQDDEPSSSLLPDPTAHD